MHPEANEPRRSKSGWLIGFVLCAAIAVVFAMLMRQPARQAWYGYLNDHAIAHYTGRMETFNARKDKNLPRGAVLFYGDSLVQGLAVVAASPLAVNYGIGHATTQQVVRQLQQHQNVSKASAVVLAVGINDVLAGNASKVPPGYQEALAAIPEHLPVLINQLLPVDEAALGHTGVSAAVQAVNTALGQLCTGSKRIRCVNAGAALSDQTGQLASRYHIGDGLHLSAAGNAIWLDHLKTAISSSVGDNRQDVIGDYGR